MKDLSWGMFVALAAGAVFIALGTPLGPVLFLVVAVSILIAYRYTYLSFYCALFLVPFLGLTISIPTGELAIGKRAFGGAIDIGLAEAFLLAVLLVWAFKIAWLWVRRGDKNWRPTFPLLRSYATLVAAHVASAFSPLLPDSILVFKFAMRPVLFCYLAFIALPVNLLRSRRRLVAALGIVNVIGTIAALNGAVSLFFVGAESQFLRRAHPLPMFGIPALGDNHNLLAELMTVTVPVTLALTLLVKSARMRRLLQSSAILQFLIGLLTFSRTGWIVFGAEAIFLAAFEYRHIVRRHASAIVASLIVLIPLGAVMLNIGLSNVAASSTSTRVALLEIATDVFLTSPWIGSGAGTFVERVGSAQVFRIEYGEPLDAHGFLQKLAAETGILGLVAFVLVVFEFCWLMRRGLMHVPHGPARSAIVFLTVGASGAILYQLFNTNYWTGKMWLPLGLALAALTALSPREKTSSDV